MKGRKAFIEAQGASCRNWRWSWSFVDHENKRVIFGAWSDNETPEGQIILEDQWRVHNGRIQPAYAESLEHIELIRSGYRLLTFQMSRESDPETGTARIVDLTPELQEKDLVRQGAAWLAVDLKQGSIIE